MALNRVTLANLSRRALVGERPDGAVEDAIRRVLGPISAYFFLLEPLLLELDLLLLLFELDELFFEPLELPDLVGMNTLLPAP